MAMGDDAPFYAPGHKRGAGIAQALKDFLGNSVFRADLPELPELDNLFAPEGVIAEAQELAAEAFGAEKTWFLVNGSTCGIIAAILATCSPGDYIILPRNIHQSAIAGLVLSGAIPIFITPEYNREFDLAYSITPETIEKALKEYPDTKAVMVVYPTYHGVCGDLDAIVRLTHQYNIPLLVDEAHGAHFSFHPQLPPSALSSGADLTIQSTHKVLGSMTQSSMVHLQGKRIDAQRISKALQLVQSTSPSYLLLASLDAARSQMALEGNLLLTDTIQLAKNARRSISQLERLSVFQPQHSLAGCKMLDVTRLTVKVSDLGLSGFAVDEILHRQLGVTAELPMLHHLTFIISIGNTSKDIDKLINAFSVVSNQLSVISEDNRLLPTLPMLPTLPTLSPRDAFFAPTETIPLEQSIGYISAETICPYPPGIPLVMLGEIISQTALEYLQQLIELGATITGCSDPTLQTLKVL
jgi:arginine/lysine/ornithine decarboxylase